MPEVDENPTEAAVEGQEPAEESNQTPSSAEAPAAAEEVSKPVTARDFMGPVEETEDFSVGTWQGLPNYRCKHFRGGNPDVPCPFETLSIDRMLEHIGREAAQHRPPDVDAWGNPIVRS